MHIAEGLHRAALTNRNGIAYVDQGAKRTWIEMQSAVRRLTGGLVSKSVAMGDRVAVLASNSARQLECFYAIPSLGAITVPLNWRWSDREIADAIKDCEPTLILADTQNMSRVAGVAQSGIPVLRLGDDTDRLIADSEERAPSKQPHLQFLYPGTSITWTARSQSGGNPQGVLYWASKSGSPTTTTRKCRPARSASYSSAAIS